MDEELDRDKFKEIQLDRYFHKSLRLEKENELLSLLQKHDMSILEYANKFNELGCFRPRIIGSN